MANPDFKVAFVAEDATPRPDFRVAEVAADAVPAPDFLYEEAISGLLSDFRVAKVTTGARADFRFATANWTPTRAGAAMIGWWDAKDPATVTQSSGAVSAWSSKTGGHVLSQATAAARPTWSLTAFPGGLPGVATDGAAVDGDMLSSATGPFDTDAWIFMAVSKGVQTDDASVATRTMFRTSVGGVIARVIGFRPTTDAGLGYLRIAGSGTGSATGEQQGFFAGPHILFANISAAALQTRFDGNAAGTIGAVGTDPITVFEIGGSSAGPAAERFAGVFGEILIVDKGALPGGGTDAERQTFEGYLAWRWGTQGALPANHPYKNAKP